MIHYISYCWLLWLGGSRGGGGACSSEAGGGGGAVATVGFAALASWAAGAASGGAAPEPLSEEGGGMLLLLLLLLLSSLGAPLLGVPPSLRFSDGGAAFSAAVEGGSDALRGGVAWVSEGGSAGAASSEQRRVQINVSEHRKSKKTRTILSQHNHPELSAIKMYYDS